MDRKNKLKEYCKKNNIEYNNLSQEERKILIGSLGYQSFLLTQYANELKLSVLKSIEDVQSKILKEYEDE